VQTRSRQDASDGVEEEQITNDQDIVERARKRADEKLGFYIHLAAYLLVNALLIVLDLMTSPGTYWFMWPLIGWGIGVSVHGLGVFVVGDGLAIRRKMIDAEIRKQGRS
jgi:hypothetical protein